MDDAAGILQRDALIGLNSYWRAKKFYYDRLGNLEYFVRNAKQDATTSSGTWAVWKLTFAGPPGGNLTTIEGPTDSLSHTFFDTNYWEIGGAKNLGSYDYGNSEWDSELSGGAHFVYLTPVSTWHQDYRPHSVTVTFTGGSGGQIAIGLVDSDLTTLVTLLPMDSGDERVISWSGKDIYNLVGFVVGDNPFSITNITFATII